jgi:hypothetical protein
MDLEWAIDQYKDGSRTKIQSVRDLMRIIDSTEGIDENCKQIVLDQYINTLRLHDRQNNVRGSARTMRFEGGMHEVKDAMKKQKGSSNDMENSGQ